MSINPVRVVNAYLSAAYDGTNGSDLAAAIASMSIVSDTGIALVLSHYGVEELTLNVGDWIVWREAGSNVDLFGTFTDERYQQFFAPLPS